MHNNYGINVFALSNRLTLVQNKRDSCVLLSAFLLNIIHYTFVPQNPKAKKSGLSAQVLKAAYFQREVYCLYAFEVEMCETLNNFSRTSKFFKVNISAVVN
jgi:hypothetical protein